MVKNHEKRSQQFCDTVTLGSAFKNRNENLDTISVIGLGTKDFVSDEIL